MLLRDRFLSLVRRIVGTQMVVDILRDQRRADDWASYMASDVLVAELRRRLSEAGGTEAGLLEGRVRDHLVAIIGARLGVGRQSHIHASVNAAYKDLSNHRNPEVVGLAELIAMDFREALGDAGLPLDVACRYYDILYGLYHWGAQRFTDMARVDTKAVIPFAEWLRRHHPPMPASRPLPQPGQPLRVGYLCTYAHLDRGNAIAALVRSIVLEHARQPNRDVFMYCVQWSSTEFVADFDGTGVTVRDLPQGHTYGSLDAIVNAIRADRIDVLITDTGTAVPTYVFSRRAAPVQMWIDMGYPFWSIGELDWVLGGKAELPGYYGIRQDRYSQFTMAIRAPEDVRVVQDVDVEAARGLIPANGFVMACFSRLIKLTPEYVRVVRRLLRLIPSSHFLLVGGGMSHEAEDLASDPKLGARVTLVRGMVDLAVYGRVVEVFLDTFPTSAGVAAVEMAVSGVPIVSLDDRDADRDMSLQRDPALVAKTTDEYCDLVHRIATDPVFRSVRREAALALGRRFSDVHDITGPIEDGIAKAIADVKARAARRSPIGGV